MKKFLLSIATGLLAVSANAEALVDYEIDFAEQAKFPFYVMGYEPQIVDGVLKAEYPGEWYQFFIGDQIQTVVGKDYTATVRIKASQAGALTLNMGWGWGEGEVINSSVNATEEWQDARTVFQGIGGTNCNLVLQPGNHEGVIEIAWVKVTHNEEGIAIPTPDEGDMLASYFDSNGETFGGWGASFENIEEEGKPCLKISNEEAKDEWAVQFAIDRAYEPGTTYYLNFDVKGTPFKGISTEFQCQDGYVGCGRMSKFDVTDEWTNVTIYGEALKSGDKEPDRMVCSVGKYVGTMYITNVKLYTARTSGAEEVVAPRENRVVVYNLQGIKVLESDDTSLLDTLPGGIYIVNGKKMVF